MSGGKWTIEHGQFETFVYDAAGCEVARFSNSNDARACVEAHNAAIDRAEERGQRVSDADLVKWAKEATHGCWEDNLVLDLRDARAEIATLRKALATAQRDGWIAGRDAAASVVSAMSDVARAGYDTERALLTTGFVCDVLQELCALLTPPNIVRPTVEGE